MTCHSCKILFPSLSEKSDLHLHLFIPTHPFKLYLFFYLYPGEFSKDSGRVNLIFLNLSVLCLFSFVLIYMQAFLILCSCFLHFTNTRFFTDWRFVATLPWASLSAPFFSLCVSVSRFANSCNISSFFTIIFVWWSVIGDYDLLKAKTLVCIFQQ